jgi:CRISPR-associated endonuclease/helicase Cas3
LIIYPRTAIGMLDFLEFFREATRTEPRPASDPYPYQVRLAGTPIASRALRVPTGAGKTAAAILSWLYRLKRGEPDAPRRLVYCLPMRVLVEQTRDNAREWTARVAKDVEVATLMGGEVEDTWEIQPERPFILIGTQDMLLSRALNRGYGMSRYKWPVHFGLLNNDCLWVCDEVQLMGSGLGTTTQLQSWREVMGGFGPRATWWMSATMEPAWLGTVDYQEAAACLPVDHLNCEDLVNGDLKRKYFASKPLYELNSLTASAVQDEHRPASLTLVIVNTVKRARALYNALSGQPTKKKTPARPPILLIHSRFRPGDRKEQVRRLLLADLRLRGEPCEVVSPEDEEWLADAAETGVIVVSTQVVEAGVDISAETLITEVAPWASLVQRFGRLNRFGKQNEHARAFRVNLAKSECAPYVFEDLKESWKILDALSEVKIPTLEATKFDCPARTHVLRRHDLHGLYSTERDLAGGFTDVSPYVRDLSTESDVYVYWRDFNITPTIDSPAPVAEELCHVPFREVKDFLDKQRPAWEWDAEEETWSARRGNDIRPGMTLLLARSEGGYSRNLGWTGDKSDVPLLVNAKADRLDSMKRDWRSETGWYPLAPHLFDAEAEAKRLVKALGLAESPEGTAVVLGALWHDVGKAHPRWQTAAIQGLDAPGSGPWAKFPHIEKRLFRPGLRHEMASALGAWQLWQRGEKQWTALAVYLIACHHGKVRTVLRARLRSGQDVFGIRPNDVLPPLEGWMPNEVKTDLGCKMFGAAGEWDDAMSTFAAAEPSWVGMVAELLGPEFPDDPAPVDAVPEGEPRTLGPFRLSFLECLIATADIWASRKPAV